jgi:1-deoxy-D-xylulose-5-phosphate synthase
MAPKSTVELREMLHYAATCQFPVAIRYPRGNSEDTDGLTVKEILYGEAEVLETAGEHVSGKAVALFAVGNTVGLAYHLKARLEAEGVSVSIVNARFVAPMDESTLLSMAMNHDVVVTLEENVARGGYGERVSALFMEENVPVRHIIGAISNQFIEHGGQQTLRDLYGLNEDELYQRIREVL